MILVYKDSVYELYEYSPTICNLFGIDMEKHSLLTRIRFFLEILLWGGYKVYYLKEENAFVASCIVSYGRNRRYFFAEPEDIIVGPYYVAPNYRGRGLSVYILKLVLNNTSISYKVAWDYIFNSNIPSIKASERVGFKKEMVISISEITHKMKINDKGKYSVYKFIRG